MDAEKDIEVGSHTSNSQHSGPFVRIDMRILSLVSFISGVMSVIIICIFQNYKPYSVRKVALGGALEVLEIAKTVSFVVAGVTAVSQIQFGVGRYVEILPRNRAGVLRAVIFAILLAFLSGGFQHHVSDKMWEDEHMFYRGMSTSSVDVASSSTSTVASATATA